MGDNVSQMATHGTKKTKPESRISCRVDRSLMERISRVAKENGISDSDVVRMALNQQLPRKGKEAA